MTERIIIRQRHFVSATVWKHPDPLFRGTQFVLVDLISWSLTSLFSTNMAIPETKGQGKSYPYPVKEGQ